jgi:hypothetical protein
MKDSMVYGYWLWFFLALFVLRVLGQIVVVAFHPRWLPPMSQWYSGLIPYHFLLPIQLVMIFVMGLVAYDFVRDQGVFVVPRPDIGRGVVWFSYVYAASMAARYLISMFQHPDRRWFGGTIPIIFHFVLAAFLYVCGSYHAL